MNRIRKYTLCLCAAIISILIFNTVAFADSYEFTITGPASCGVGDSIDVTITLTSDEILSDSDVFFVYDTGYFEYVDSDSDDYDSYAGKVRLRGDFSEDSYTCSWNVTLKATNEGSATFTLTDKWVKNGAGQVVTSTAEDFTIEVGTESSVSNTGGVDTSDLATSVYFEKEFEFYFTEPDEVPTCFDETTGIVCGLESRVWKFNSAMEQDVDYSADLAEFYAVYGYTDSEDEESWYLYDTVNGTFQRLLMLQDVEVEKTPEPAAEKDTGALASSDNIFSDITKLIIIVFVVLVILIIVVNVIFSKLEKKSRRKRIQERQRLSREELAQKRELERKIQEKRSQEENSQNMRRPDNK